MYFSYENKANPKPPVHVERGERPISPLHPGTWRWWLQHDDLMRKHLRARPCWGAAHCLATAQDVPAAIACELSVSDDQDTVHQRGAEAE